MRTGTRRHAIHPIASHLSIEHVPVSKKNQQEDWIACHRVPWRCFVAPGTRLRPNSPEILMTCPKCGETRLIERIDRNRWFCAVCAYSWTIGAAHREDEGLSMWPWWGIFIPMERAVRDRKSCGGSPFNREVSRRVERGVDGSNGRRELQIRVPELVLVCDEHGQD
jgi:hypothetical protein